MNLIMTLNEWADKYMIAIGYHGTEGIRYIPDFISDSRPLLWQLKDYRITSVSGGTIWLAPRN